MTGGGRARSGGMGQKVTAGLLDETVVDQTPQMKQSIEEYERRVSKLLPSIAKLEKQEEHLRNTISQLEAEHKRISLDIQVNVLA
jgi:chromosome segregation ATPase